MTSILKRIKKEKTFILEGIIINYFYQPDLAVIYAYVELFKRGKVTTQCINSLNKFAKEKKHEDWSSFFIKFLSHNPDTNLELYSESHLIKNKDTPPSLVLNKYFDSNNKVTVITIASVIFLAFFMPWIQILVNISAWDIVFGTSGSMIGSPIRFLAIIIPVSSGMIIYNIVFNESKFPISKPLLFSLSFLTLITILIVIQFQTSDIFKSKELLNLFGIGAWLSFIASAILLILGLTSLKEHPHFTKAANNEISANEKSKSVNQLFMLKQLEKLQKMKQDNEITSEEYQKIKSKIIGSFD